MKYLLILLVLLWLLDVVIYCLHRDRRKKRQAWLRLKLDLVLYLLIAFFLWSLFRYFQRLL